MAKGISHKKETKKPKKAKPAKEVHKNRTDVRFLYLRVI